MITLNVADLDVTSGAIPITWCVDHELINTMVTELEIKNPILLMVIAPQESYSVRKEDRQVMRLSDLMTYVSFRTPRKNKIFVAILSNCSNLKDAKNLYLEKWNRNFQCEVLDSDGQDFGPNFKEHIAVQSASVEVDVPLESFAKEPASWEKAWVLWLMRDKGIDQCDFRRKRLFAYTIQPFIFIANMLVRLLMTAISGSLLLRSFTLKYLFSPLTYDLDCIGNLVDEGSIAILNLKRFRSKDYSSPARDIMVFILEITPLLLCPIILVPIIIGFTVSPTFRIMFPAMFLLLIVTALIVSIVLSIANLDFPKYRSKKVVILSEQDLLQVVCDPNKVGKKPKFSDLPSNKKTIKLRYQNLKSKVCRPFAG
jgi:hypothetical protein